MIQNFIKRGGERRGGSRWSMSHKLTVMLPLMSDLMIVKPEPIFSVICSDGGWGRGGGAKA